ncbi:MAG: type II secretion system protein GspE [Omnitrophica WOR_2 bacterium GWF2_43_52]|nr:MAG: type II secretion system protein GspE [Omnitrophica WOR_2 bacterium GWC2_44_8]OGX20431.1 MAG: type II secretion system protein GspE [Omnitrophica WOR_2 bacterium GWF2_43_52]OGX53051.1 MAG: type II secretion system protein GspE [Omnitrophica WOR_2 bacterium RIFOXYC2_FULL_43_9]
MAEISYKKIGEILIEQGFISMEQLREALEEQKLTGEKVGEILVKKGVVGQEEIELALSKQKGIARFDLSNYIIEPSLFKLIPEDFARKYKLLPVFLIENTLTVAMADPTNVFIIDELQRLTKLMVEPVLAQELEIKKSQDQYYGGSGTLLEIVASIDRSKLSEGEKLGEEAPIIKIVNYLIMQAVQLKASDIHIEPEEKTLNIRYRVDGLLRRQSPLPKDLSGAVISRFKIMSGLDISEKRLPQDGRIIMKIGNKDIDFRVSTCPTIHGENVVLRILDKSGVVLGLETLGFPAKELGMFQEMIHSPYGIILVTGPTGSGKTTTLYSALQILNKETVNIMTVEDPVEYQFPGIRQVPVNVKTGLTFAAALRSFLRQDPNIIMLGEIRDHETAEIAIQAALTGHLVLSTLHTNDSSSAFSRLIDMGIEPFLVSSSILGVMAQRLIRRVCERCKESYAPSEEALRNIGLADKIGQNITFNKGIGCKLCNSSGYKGRLGIYEILKVSPKVQETVLKRSSADDIRAIAIKEGLSTLRDAALQKLLAGLTTPEEVMRVTLEASE